MHVTYRKTSYYTDRQDDVDQPLSDYIFEQLEGGGRTYRRHLEDKVENANRIIANILNYMMDVGDINLEQLDSICADKVDFPRWDKEFKVINDKPSS
jgi:hypothetical protein